MLFSLAAFKIFALSLVFLQFAFDVSGCAVLSFHYGWAYRHTLFYRASLGYILQTLERFYRLEACGNLALSKSVGTIFEAAFTHLGSLCCILVILTVFRTFSLFYLLW